MRKSKVEASQNQHSEESSSESWYLERRGFIKQAMFAALAAGTVGTSGQTVAQTSERFDLSTPLRLSRMTKKEHTKMSDREEASVELEVIGANDVRSLTTTYMKRVDTETKYDILMVSHTQYFRKSTNTVADKTLSKTTSIVGLKGLIDGDVRIDQITSTVFLDGCAFATGPIETRVMLKNPYETMTEQDMVDAILAAKTKK